MSDAQFQTALAHYREGRHVEGGRLLRQAARAGHAPAMSVLGYQMLSGRGAPLDRVAGIRMTLAAADRGDAAAATVAAALVAAGVFGAPDWPRALDYLQRGARAGFPMAQAQLRLLAGHGGDDWASLRREVDIQAWRTAPAPRILCREPNVKAFEGMASPAVCEWIIGRARARLAPATVYDKSGGGVVGATRDNSAFELGLADLDLVVLALRERLAAAAGLPVMTLNAPQVLHYAVGQRFEPHVDFFDPAIPDQARRIASVGQRAATVLLYLNEEGLEGGETEFPLAHLRHRGRKGDALVFFNLDAEGRPDRRTVHAGLPPTRGEKWLLSQWIRDGAPLS
jgi:predicted 2-oxoglutarate/Fe(II)-dependent dioxygenase YbiX